jgi:hypothetical protein
MFSTKTFLIKLSILFSRQIKFICSTSWFHLISHKIKFFYWFCFLLHKNENGFFFRYIDFPTMNKYNIDSIAIWAFQLNSKTMWISSVKVFKKCKQKLSLKKALQFYYFFFRTTLIQIFIFFAYQPTSVAL